MIEVKKIDKKHRPEYHFMPRANWMNDPNAPIYYKGKYHIFFQHNPYEARFGLMHWGHAVSEDMIHWKHKPIAIAPSKDYDKEGVFSGSSVVHNSRHYVFYTGIPKLGEKEVQCLAISEDMENWKKYRENPIIKSPPETLNNVVGFRDPYIFKEDNLWFMVIGSGIEDEGGAVLLYQSQDLLDWEYAGILYHEKQRKSGIMWECPNFIKLDNKYVLIVSPYDRLIYWIGDFKDKKFVPDKQGYLDFGDAFYASNILKDVEGNQIVWGWLKEERGEREQINDGWSGVLSLPRKLSINEDKLSVSPSEALKKLRDTKLIDDKLQLKDENINLKGVKGKQLEIKADIRNVDADSFGLNVRETLDGEEKTEIKYKKEGTFTIDATTSSLSNNVEKNICQGNIERVTEINLQIFIDNSVIEVFINNQHSMSKRVYPTRDDAIYVSLFAREGKIKVNSSKAWNLKSIY